MIEYGNRFNVYSFCYEIVEGVQLIDKKVKTCLLSYSSKLISVDGELLRATIGPTSSRATSLPTVIAFCN